MPQTIDTTSLTELITEFRKLTAKDAITPESLGAVLQRITDLLATAGTQETTAIMSQWYAAMRIAQPYISSIVQGTADRNNIYLNRTSVNPISGVATGTVNAIPILQATTDRAGAMRAQQVIDLNTARNTINSTILPQLETLDAKITALLGGSDETVALMGKAQIACEVVGSQLQVYGAAALIKAGYVPYLFRHTRRRNRHRNSSDPTITHSLPTKGWHLYGSRHSVRVVGTRVEFSTNTSKDLHNKATAYSPYCSALVKLHRRDDGTLSLPWGRSMIRLYDRFAKHERMLRLPFAIGFAKPIDHGTQKVNVLNLVSNLAEFTLVYNPVTKAFDFSR